MARNGKLWLEMAGIDGNMRNFWIWLEIAKNS